MDNNLTEVAADWGPAASSQYKLVIHSGSDGYVPSGSVGVVDVETDEADLAKFVGAALVMVCGDSDGSKLVHYYSSLTDPLKAFLNRIKIVGHNVKSDVHWLNSWGCQIKAEQIIGDTMIIAYCKDTTELEYGLKAQAKKHLGWTWKTYKEMVGKGKKKQTLDKQPVEVVAAYCGTDAAATAELYRRLLPGAGRNYYELEMPCYRAIFDMESKGAAVDIPYLSKLHEEFLRRQDGALGTLRSFAGAEFNPASPKQVKENLLKKLGIRADKTDVATLKEHKGVPEVASLLEYREFSKLASTYTGVLLDLPTPGRVHASFNQVAYEAASEASRGIRTGRLSSSGPNLQNIPSRTETGKMVRQAFIPSPGNLLVVADYSQIELRVLAHYSGEKTFIDAFLAGRDVHTETAEKMFGKASTEEVAKKNRSIAKTINFGLLYGCGAKKLAYLTNVSEEQAKKMLDDYWAAVPGIKTWIAVQRAQAYVRGGTKTLSGRFIPLAGLKASDMYERFAAERQAVNYTIQGSAAEIMKRALIRLHARGVPITMTVHDEFIVDVQADKAEHTLRVVKSVMENVVQLKVPLLVEAKIGKNWAEAK